MAWNAGSPFLSIRFRDAGGKSTTTKMRLVSPGASPVTADFDALEAYVISLLTALDLIVDVQMEDTILSLPAVPDGTTDLVEVGAIKSEVENKGVFLFSTDSLNAGGRTGRFTIPALDWAASDGGSPARTVAAAGNRDEIDLLQTNIASIVAAVKAPATPLADQVYGAVIVSSDTYLYSSVKAAYKQHRKPVAGDSGSTNSTRRTG